MTKTPRPVADDFETRVLLVFQNKRRYVLIGEVSLEVGYRLETVEYHLERLVRLGALRHADEAERRAIGMHRLTVAYVLADASKFTLVSRPLQ